MHFMLYEAVVFEDCVAGADRGDRISEALAELSADGSIIVMAVDAIREANERLVGMVLTARDAHSRQRTEISLNLWRNVVEVFNGRYVGPHFQGYHEMLSTVMDTCLQNEDPVARSFLGAPGPSSTRPIRAIEPLSPRQASVRRNPVELFAETYPWDTPGYWALPPGLLPAGRTFTNLTDIPDNLLWDSLNWLTGNVMQLHVAATANRPMRSADRARPPGLLARHWLASTATFRSLLQEAIRRELTLSRETFAFVRAYVLSDNDVALRVDAPWRDPHERSQADALRPFLNEPVVKEQSIQERYGRTRRLDL